MNSTYTSDVRRSLDRQAKLEGLVVVSEADAQALADIDYLDEAARRLGTRLDIPADLPDIDEDHAHFILMPIGAAARRAAVLWLKAREGLR